MKLFDRIVSMAFYISLAYLFIVAMLSDADEISIKQAAIHGIIGIVVFAISALMIMYATSKKEL